MLNIILILYFENNTTGRDRGKDSRQVLDHRLINLTIVILFPGSGKDFSFIHIIQISSEPHTASYSINNKGAFSRHKVTGA